MLRFASLAVLILFASSATALPTGATCKTREYFDADRLLLPLSTPLRQLHLNEYPDCMRPRPLPNLRQLRQLDAVPERHIRGQAQTRLHTLLLSFLRYLLRRAVELRDVLQRRILPNVWWAVHAGIAAARGGDVYAWSGWKGTWGSRRREAEVKKARQGG
ncbi:hypothetical protein JCM10213v2_001117 [Rhodosporidiobolus nylandii]